MSLLDSIRGLTGAPTIDQPNLPTQEWLEAAADMGGERVARYSLYEKYAAGDQTTTLTSEQRTCLEASGLPYVENICKPVLDAQTNRLKVTGFQVQGNDAATDWLNEAWWARNRMGVRQRAIHRGTALRGDGFLLAEPDFDEGIVALRRQRAEQIKPVYGDDEDELLYVVKVWPSKRKGPLNPEGRSIRRMNLFYPDRIEKYFTVASEGGAWSPWLDETDQEPITETDDDGRELLVDGEPVPVFVDGVPAMRGLWPTPWTMDGTPEGEPIGVNIIHFREDAGDDPFGRSVIRSVIPQQDMLTRQLGDMASVLDHAFPVNTASGVDTEGALRIRPGYWMKGPQGAQFGQLPGADPRPIQDAVEGTMRRVSVTSSTPVHSLVPSGSLPSGESLKTAEGPLTKANEDRQSAHTTPWERAARISDRIAQAFGFEAASIAPDAVVTVVWEPVETRNDESEVAVAEAKQRLGVSRRTLLRELGYDPDEELEQSRVEQRATLQAAQAAFNAGRVPGVEDDDGAPADEPNRTDRSDGEP